MNVIECDGIAEIVAESLEDILAIQLDPEIVAVRRQWLMGTSTLILKLIAQADEFSFIDKASLTSVVSQANVVWEKGAAVAEV